MKTTLAVISLEKKSINFYYFEFACLEYPLIKDAFSSKKRKLIEITHHQSL